MDAVKRNERILHADHRRAVGQAPTLAFSNSLGTDLRIWDAVVTRLPKDLGILRYDTAGHGLSPAGAAMSIDDHADDLAALLDAKEIDRAVVVGLSVGGLIAQALAQRAPQRVAGLVLSNTGMTIGTAEIWNARAEAIRAGGMEAIADATMERWFSPRFRAGKPEALQLWRTMLAHTPPAGYIDLGLAIRDADYRDAAAQVSVPALCIAGAQDSATTPAVVRAMADAIPQARFEEIPDVGHLPCIEAPGTMAELISRFVSEALT